MNEKLLQLIFDYGCERRHCGWLEKYSDDLGSICNPSTREHALRNLKTARQKCDRLFESINKELSRGP